MTFFLLLGGLVALLYLGMPMFAALFLLPLGVLFWTEGAVPALGEMVVGKLDGYLLVAIPLFMLMAHIMVRGRVVDDLYNAAFALLRRVRGGVGIATVAACTIFAAISGSSVATALTIGKIAIPQMLRYGMSRRGAFGVVAGGGTLGILIPPSAPMVLYAYVTETSVAALFLAGLIPGLLMAAMFAGYCFITEGRATVPADEPVPESAQRAVMRAGWSLSLPIFVLGGIYLGIFTATEAAGTGTIYALLIAALIYRTLTWRDLIQGVGEATRTSAMLLMIIAGAAIYGYMLTKLQVPQELTRLVADFGLGRTGFLIAMMVLLFLLGLVLESFSIILLTMPAILPLLGVLGIDKVWYGILLTLSLEMALISPPVALNLVVIKAITGAPLAEVNRSIYPYMLMLAFGTAMLIAFPDIALWLPRVAGYGG
ncbi:TRAP transporter large permease [Falsiroseomonas selenitidurans]|uniref:TRAP transporter large permease protein n=1 Tax=Falsiroseomonas selenitidurans TaxID=2716335 RepID=A0ABX1EBE7_9PROT|nr:TRAP transporter large permease [Falsiroseomonas selenitidurans]NKC32812.1 TRAP transporter large permease [Falsiroseomonas selenitidurans]